MKQTCNVKRWFQIVAVIIVGVLIVLRVPKIAKNVKRKQKAIGQESFVSCTTRNEQHAVATSIQDIVNQPFFYLGAGRQSIAFVSLDNQYVIKLLKNQTASRKKYYDYLPDFFLVKKLRKAKEKHRKKRYEKLLQSQKIAELSLEEETGTVYAHTQSSSSILQMLCMDKRGKLLHLDLNRLRFVIQRKARPIKKEIITLMYLGQVDECRLRIHALFDLLEKCQKKGVWDRDTALIRNDNVGFVDSHAIYIDTGKLAKFRDKPAVFYAQYDLKRLRPLKKWLAVHYPELSALFFTRSQEYLAHSRKSPGHLREDRENSKENP